jgi:hypothetical protein
VIGSISPSSGPVGTQVTITGTLQGISSVLFPGAAGPLQTGFTPLSATTLTVIVPEGAANGPIEVDNAAGSAMSVPFTVTAGTPPPPPPVISEFDPASGSVGSTVFIGGNFPGTVTAVYFNGTAAPFSVCCNGQPSEITATVPPGATTGLITVQTSNGNAVSQTNFTVF